jgi:nitrite reductase/ring-hydroxylating ferredoxin subunit
MQTIELRLQEIPLNAPFHVKHEGTDIVVIRSSEAVTAYLDVCPHASWPLSKGEVIDGVLECPGHGWEFQIETGRCLTAPAYCLTAVAVIVDGDCVRLEFEPAPPAAREQTAGQKACRAVV